MEIPQALQEQLEQLPQLPGVYQFFDERGILLYIGKATNLRSRVRSYFRESTQLSNRKIHMVFLIRSVEITVVDNEPEALLLETTLIKKYRPAYNVVMKDDKNFQYIHITDSAFPRLETTRKLPMTGRKGRYFGPYTSGYSVKTTLRLLKQIFHFCESPPVDKKGVIEYPKRPCLDYHLGRCIGPCAKDISAEEYALMFDDVERFLKGDYHPVHRTVESQMKKASAAEQFEKAARLRDQLTGIVRLMEEQKVVSTTRENADYISLFRMDSRAAVNVFTVRKGMVIHQEVFILGHTKDQSDVDVLEAFRDQYYAQTMTRPKKIVLNTEERRGRNRKLLEMGAVNAEEALKRQQASFEKKEKEAHEGLEQLGKVVGIPGEKLHRVEIYDISNFQGKNSVGSMVVFTDGRPDHAQYRKFKIKTVQGPNDFASMREVINRRVRHLPGRGRQHAEKKDFEWPMPDLIIIDGGKGQLSAALSMIDASSVDIPVVSLAKKKEEIFLPGATEGVIMPEGSPGLHLVQRMRDEAHRFAIGFYRKRHLKELV